MSKQQIIVKRAFDFLFSLLLIFILWPIILTSYIASCLSTKSHGLFIQERIGKNGKKFKLFKIKTMKSLDNDISIASLEKSRITRIGRVLRKFKIDEFPQLFNILIGDMSFVGPRPDVKGYADKLIGNNRIILKLKPGLTGPSSIKYRNEEYILANVKNKKKYNDEVIWPDKTRLNLVYYNEYSFYKDIIYLIKTVLHYK